MIEIKLKTREDDSYGYIIMGTISVVSLVIAALGYLAMIIGICLLFLYLIKKTK